ncbi:MAG: DUF3696 domain-containing protein [Desulfuromonadales bacterium]|nr:DUF3696 domain-containing protein [Desulfuromonadales bacterium]
MSGLTHLRLENFRCFKDSGYVPIKPITIFVGRNSSGKSSFLRTLPLLRQSVESNTKGPVLWYGNYVDFGTFEDIKSFSGEDNQTVILSFKFDEPILRSRQNALSRRTKFPDGHSKNSSIGVSIGLTGDKNKTEAKSLKIDINRNTVEFELKNERVVNFRINNIDYMEHFGTIRISFKKGLIPEFLEELEDEFIDDDGENHRITYLEKCKFEEKFRQVAILSLGKHFHKNTSRDTIKTSINRVNLYQTDEHIQNVLYLTNRTQKKFTKNLKNNGDEIIKDFKHFSFCLNIEAILNDVEKHLKSYFMSVKYLGPIRAVAERYYRHQDLQVSEVDHTGSNLPMVLKSLARHHTKNFTKWTNDNFGFSVKVAEVGQHYALKVTTTEDSQEYNITDMGFGFSQLLPIIASLWLNGVQSHPFLREQSYFVLEQPELHLHPALQAKLADAFCQITNLTKGHSSEQSSYRIILETHSKAIVDAIGDNIASGKISSDDVSLVFFEKRQGQDTNVQLAEYDEGGYLKNWPIGFFSGRA